MAEKQKRWLRDYEVEEASGGLFKASTLRKDRIGKQIYPFHRIGKTILYELGELDATVQNSRFGGKAGTGTKANGPKVA